MPVINVLILSLSHIEAETERDLIITSLLLRIGYRAVLQTGKLMMAQI